MLKFCFLIVGKFYLDMRDLCSDSELPFLLNGVDESMHMLAAGNLGVNDYHLVTGIVK